MGTQREQFPGQRQLSENFEAPQSANASSLRQARVKLCALFGIARPSWGHFGSIWGPVAPSCGTVLRHRPVAPGTILWHLAPSCGTWHCPVVPGTVLWHRPVAPGTILWHLAPSCGTWHHPMAPSCGTSHLAPSCGNVTWHQHHYNSDKLQRSLIQTPWKHYQRANSQRKQITSCKSS